MLCKNSQSLGMESLFKHSYRSKVFSNKFLKDILRTPIHRFILLQFHIIDIIHRSLSYRNNPLIFSVNQEAVLCAIKTCITNLVIRNTNIQENQK